MLVNSFFGIVFRIERFRAHFLKLQIRQNDRLAVSKLVTSLTRGTVRSPLAQCLLIRYTSQVLNLLEISFMF